MKTLYVTDLDGTLLNSNEMLSNYTVETLNSLISAGMCFSYATARSLSSASFVTKSLTLKIPVIIYNGTFIVKHDTKEKLFSLSFNQNEKEKIMEKLTENSIFPLVYGYINGEEKVSWMKNKENDGIKDYINSRKGDRRLRAVENSEELYKGETFYFTCVGSKNELENIYECFKGADDVTCTLQQELYREDYWCEIMPKMATKGNAIVTLSEIMKCDKIITFGDAINDISMFKVSDECYAVENAVKELKEYATGIIKSNDEDGVVRWLEENYRKE